MIVRRILLPIEVKKPFKKLFDSIPSNADGAADFKASFEFSTCSDRGPPIIDDDGIVGWAIGDDDSGAPAYFALRRNGKIDKRSESYPS